MRRIASIVAMASRRRSSSPVERGKVERVEDQVARFQSVAVDGQVVDAVGDPHLPLDITGLALLVDEQADHGGAVFAGELHDAVESLTLTVAVLEVGRVEDGPAAHPLEAGLHHLGFGGVQDQRHAGLGAEAAGDLVHVGGAVASDVVDAEVQDVRPLAHLVLGHLHRAVPVALQEGITELLRTVGVGALSDDQERRVLLERDEAVDRGGAVLVGRLARRGRQVGHGRGQLADEVRCGATAAADHADAQLGDEPGLVLDELLGGQVVVHLAVDHRRQPGVGQARDGDPGVLGQVAEVLVHLAGSGRAVESDHVGSHRVEGRQGGADLGAGQHAPGEFHGDLHLERHRLVELAHGRPAAVHGGLGAQQIELGLDDEEIDAAFEQAQRLLVVQVAQLGVADVAEGGELRARSDGTGHQAGIARRGHLLGHLAGEAGRLLVELAGPLGEVVLGQRHAEGTEGVGLDHVGAGLEVGPMHPPDDVGAGVDEQLVAPFEIGPAEVVGGQILLLKVGAGGAVEDDDAFVDQVQVPGHVGSSARRSALGSERFAGPNRTIGVYGPFWSPDVSRLGGVPTRRDRPG